MKDRKGTGNGNSGTGKLVHLTEDELAQYHDDSLQDEGIRDRLKSHLQRCLICQSRLRFLQEVVNEAQSMSAAEVPAFYTDVLQKMQQKGAPATDRPIPESRKWEAVTARLKEVFFPVWKWATPRLSIATGIAVLVCAFLIGYWMGKGSLENITATVYASDFRLASGTFRVSLNFENSQLDLFAVEQEGSGTRFRRLAAIDLIRAYRRVGANPPEDMTFPDSYRDDWFRRKVQVVDLDHDGKQEILFGTDYPNNADLNGWLFCFSESGELLWSFKLGGRYSENEHPYPPNYSVSQIVPSDLDNDGIDEVVALGTSVTWKPRQVVIIKADGNRIRHAGEYWHPGAITIFSAHEDFDKDGKREILLGGTCNDYKDAILIVLKESLLTGVESHRSIGATAIVLNGLPVRQTFEGMELPPAGAAYILRFPNPYGTREALKDSDGFMGTILWKWLAIAPQQEHIELRTIGHIFENGRWTQLDTGAIVYDLNFNFDITGVHPDQPYRNYRGRLRGEGWLAKTLDEEMQDVANVLYWNGKEWVTHATKIENEP
jgi:hypothetical protein